VDDAFLCAGTTYYHQDQLSNRLVTDSAGHTVEQMGHYPFGDPWYNALNDKLVFTTYERDSESSNDYAQARFYRWLLGRFFSLDPLSGSISDPQSLNRYTYVENNPINLTDPSGACIHPDANTDNVRQGWICPANTDGDYLNTGAGFGGYEFDKVSIDGILYNSGQAGAILSIPGFNAQCPDGGCTQIGNIWIGLPRRLRR